jgi:hypothetical protein
VNKSRHGTVGVPLDLPRAWRRGRTQQGAHKEFALQQPNEAVAVLFRVTDFDEPLFHKPSGEHPSQLHAMVAGEAAEYLADFRQPSAFSHGDPKQR